MANSELVYNIDVTGGRMPSPTERPKLATMSLLRIDGMSLAERRTLKPFHEAQTSLFSSLLATLTVSQITDGVEW